MIKFNNSKCFGKIMSIVGASLGVTIAYNDFYKPFRLHASILHAIQATYQIKVNYKKIDTISIIRGSGVLIGPKLLATSYHVVMSLDDPECQDKKLKISHMNLPTCSGT